MSASSNIEDQRTYQPHQTLKIKQHAGLIKGGLDAHPTSSKAKNEIHKSSIIKQQKNERYINLNLFEAIRILVVARKKKSID